MYKALSYSKAEKGKAGETYSCDKIQLIFRLRFAEGQALLDALSRALWLEFEHWESRRYGTYRNQFSFKLDGERSFWLGVGLVAYGKSRPDDNCKLEFNPNKVYPSRALNWLLGECWQRAKPREGCTVKQWDLAVDYPTERSNMTLCKDARLYEEMRKSASDRTQYIGARNMPGRCKLYNKQIESGLDAPLTRLEITLGGIPGPREVVDVWPLVYRLSDFQTGAEVAALNDTDRFIFATLLQEPGRIGELGRRKRERMQTLLDAARYVVEFDPVAYEAVSGFVDGFRHRPQALPKGGDCPAWDWAGVPDGWKFDTTPDPWPAMRINSFGNGKRGRNGEK